MATIPAHPRRPLPPSVVRRAMQTRYPAAGLKDVLAEKLRRGQFKRRRGSAPAA